MGLKAKREASGESFKLEPITAALHRAVCYSVVDLGTHTNTTFGKEQRKVLLTFELPDETGEFTVWDADGKPTDEKETRRRVISQEYTNSLDERANLHRDLVGWRGKQFTEEELDGFELENLLAVTCQLQVIHQQSRKDATKVYANINGVMPRVKSDKAKMETENALTFFSLDDINSADESALDGIPKWVQEKIRASHEWKRMTEEPGGNGGHDTYEPPADEDDDLPF